MCLTPFTVLIVTSWHHACKIIKKKQYLSIYTVWAKSTYICVENIIRDFYHITDYNREQTHLFWIPIKIAQEQCLSFDMLQGTWDSTSLDKEPSPLAATITLVILCMFFWRLVAIALCWKYGYKEMDIEYNLILFTLILERLEIYYFNP